MVRYAFLCFVVFLVLDSAAADETSPVGLAATTITPDPRVQALVDAVSRDTLTKYISHLTGNEPVVIGGELDTLLTRYSYSWRFDRAVQYIYERFQDYGIPVEYHT